MEKKISIAIKELKEAMVKDIQDSGLPVVVVDLIIKDLYNEIHNLSEGVTNNDIREYQQSLSI